MDETQKPKVTIADMAAAAGPTPSAETPQASAPAQESEPSYTFFNVMPKTKDTTNMTQPTLKVEQVVEAPAAKGPSFFEKYKIYIICGAALLILGPLIYFFSNKLIGGDSTENNLLLTPGPTIHQSTSTPNTASSTQLEGFTTPQEWRDKYFENCTDPTVCGDNVDPDHDGLTNLQESNAKTDPNNADSDQDGLSDGDEINIFITDPLNPHTGGDPLYTDSDFFKGGYDIGTGKKMSPQQISAISAKMKNFGLHEPTLKTLSEVVNSIYNFSTSTSTPDSSLNGQSASSTTQSLSAKQDRDTQRSSTIKNIEIALVRYNSDTNSYPQTNDFATMYAQIKPYLKVATNPLDPVNKAPYVYSYAATADGSNFSLSFYSEVANQPISKNAAEAQQDANADQASVLDNQRQTDLENIRTALLLYSQSNVAGNQTYVFPSVDKYKPALVPNYLEVVPKDPGSGEDYNYQVSSTFNTFTIKAVLDNPPTGTTGYMCNQDECMNY